MTRMTRKRCLSSLTLAAAALFFAATDAHACSCGPTPTVLDSYEESAVVVIAKAVSVEKSEKAAPEGRMSDGENYVDGVKSTKMLIERVFKGSLKVGDEITFAQGGGANCVWTFNEESVGRQFLFYLSSREKSPKIWLAFGCGRSSGVEGAADDLLYLDKLDKVRGKTRISGTLQFTSGGDMSVANRTIRVSGAKKSYEVKTDERGVYEIYDLPPGNYLVEPETPAGWKVDRFRLGYSGGFAGGDDRKVTKKIPFVLEDGKHAAVDIHLEIDNAIRGKVYDTAGKLMRGVCLKLLPAEGKTTKHFYNTDCTEEDGAFELDEIPPGSYVIVVNEDGKVSSSEPFGTFYYPNVTERGKAAVVTVGAGDILGGFDIHAPTAAETVTLEGRFLYSDGKPVAKEWVKFEPAAAEADVDGEARAKTDAAGRFSIKILKGLRGKLYGTMYTYAGEFENCPKLEAVINKAGGSIPDLKTRESEILAAVNLYDVELKYPFPGCKKAKH